MKILIVSGLTLKNHVLLKAQTNKHVNKVTGATEAIVGFTFLAFNCRGSSQLTYSKHLLPFNLPLQPLASDPCVKTARTLIWYSLCASGRAAHTATKMRLPKRDDVKDVDAVDFKLHCVSAALYNMAPSTSQVFIDGSFADLAQELADYLHIGPEIQPLLEENKKDDALKKLVTASIALNSTPEKEFTAAYNLLVYLVVQSPSVNMFLPRMCENLSKPITSSPVNGSGLALSVLTTIFNLLQPDNEVRFNVFQAILRLVKTSGLFEMLRPQLTKLDAWLEEWEVDEEDQRKVYSQIADIAEESGEDK